MIHKPIITSTGSRYRYELVVSDAPATAFVSKALDTRAVKAVRHYE